MNTPDVLIWLERRQHFCSLSGAQTPTFPRSMNVTPFTLGGLPVDELDQGMIRSLREAADENGWTIEDVMTIAAEYYAARRQTERELETKVIEFPDPIPGLS